MYCHAVFALKTYHPLLPGLILYNITSLGLCRTVKKGNIVYFYSFQDTRPYDDFFFNQVHQYLLNLGAKRHFSPNEYN